MPQALRVAVIGAGPSGLTALKTLHQAGLEVVCFEAGRRAGGQWVIDNSSGTSAAYRSLRTNTNRSMSRFTDYTFPDDFPEYPSHAQMADWLEGYARHFGVHDRIVFSARVQSVVPLPDGAFGVSCQGRKPERFDAVVAATGNLWDPVLPTIPGTFDGPAIHSKAYRDPATPVDLRGRRVLVIGLGNSGCEIAAELSREARVLLSARSGNLILPRLAPGQTAPPHPSDLLPLLLRMLPAGARDAVFRAILPRVLARAAKALPRPEALGLPAAPRDVFAKRSIVNDEFLNLLEKRRIVPKPAVRAFEGGSVTFVDETREPVDAVVYATGYRFTLPYLSRPVLGVDDAADLPLYRGIMHPVHPRLFVVGVMRVFCSIWPQAEQQALWIARCLRGELALPDPRTIARRARPILRGPLRHCAFVAHDLRSEGRIRRPF